MCPWLDFWLLNLFMSIFLCAVHSNDPSRDANSLTAATLQKSCYVSFFWCSVVFNLICIHLSLILLLDFVFIIFQSILFLKCSLFLNRNNYFQMVYCTLSSQFWWWCAVHPVLTVIKTVSDQTCMQRLISVNWAPRVLGTQKNIGNPGYQVSFQVSLLRSFIFFPYYCEFPQIHICFYHRYLCQIGTLFKGIFILAFSVFRCLSYLQAWPNVLRRAYILIFTKVVWLRQPVVRCLYTMMEYSYRRIPFNFPFTSYYNICNLNCN